MAVELNKQHGWDLCVHVDAASGGFIAPFLTPELVSFAQARVRNLCVLSLLPSFLEPVVLAQMRQKGCDIGVVLPLLVDKTRHLWLFLLLQQVWDFRLPLVKSINVSGHKFGLVYPGTQASLPGELSAQEAQCI